MKMDDKSVRAQLAETQDRLRRVDDEREILLSLIKGFEGWLRLSSGEVARVPGPPVETPINRSAILGTISMRGAIKDILREAHGEPLKAAEILRRATDRGARTSGKRPEAVIDLNALSLSKEGHPIERVGPRTWRWKVA